MKKLSVITINYNNASGLELTMESVFGQTFIDVEYVVIDGGSSDGSKELIQANAAKIDFWCSENDKGVYNAMNKGVLHATGEYVLFLNSGDYLYDSSVLAKILPSLTGEGIVYGDLMFMPEGGGEGSVFVYPEILDVDYFMERSLGHPASFIKRELLTVSPYNEEYRIVSDWEFFFRKIVYESVTYKHVKLLVSVFDMGGISNSQTDLCAREREQVLHSFFPGMLYEYLQTCVELRKNPLYDEYCRLGRTGRLKKRLKPLLRCLLRLDDFFKQNK